MIPPIYRSGDLVILFSWSHPTIGTFIEYDAQNKNRCVVEICEYQYPRSLKAVERDVPVECILGLFHGLKDAPSDPCPACIDGTDNYWERHKNRIKTEVCGTCSGSGKVFRGGAAIWKEHIKTQSMVIKTDKKCPKCGGTGEADG